MIKGVSDLADSAKNSSATNIWRGYACNVAAAFLRALLSTGPIPLSQPQKDAENQATEADRLLEERWKHTQELRFKEAATCAEAAAELARDAHNQPIRLRALRCAARDLCNYLVDFRPTDFEAKRITSRIAEHINALATAGLAEGELAQEQALFARLDQRPDDALRYAELAEAATEDPEKVAEALLVRLHAFWQKDTPAEGLGLVQRINHVTDLLEKGDAQLVLKATWLRTLCKTKKVISEDIQHFATTARVFVAGGQVSTATALRLIDEVVCELSRGNDFAATRELLSLALEMADHSGDALRTVNIALKSAEVEAELGHEGEARRFIGIADQWLDRFRARGDRQQWASRRAAALATHGKIEARLARSAEENGGRSDRHLRAEFEALAAARSFMDTHEADLVGDVGLFRANIDLQLAQSAMKLGRMKEAAEYSRCARSEQIMAHPQFATEIGTRAWLEEAQALLFSGNLEPARSTLQDILKASTASDKQRELARQNLYWTEKHVVPVMEWFDSAAAAAIRRKVSRDGLRAVVAEQMQPLVEWCDEFPPTEESHAGSELVDIWGRGGFARVAWAVRADPGNAIVVDASSTEAIARWARVFCPLYDTVIINWKGPLHGALGMVPMPDNLGPPGAFGGQGYLRTDSIIDGREDWHVAIGWANFLPKEVSLFLITTALPLLRSGRLVVFPASLVGCTQGAVGWTDNLLLDGLLGGVVQVAGMRTAESANDHRKNRFRELDLGAISIPFIDQLPLAELDKILTDTTEWLLPLQRILRSTLSGSDLRQERWDRIGCDFSNIRDACRQLDERWRSLTTTCSPARWTVAGLSSTFSAVERQFDAVGEDSLTDLLRAVARERPDLGPWIPYWRLQEAGGEIDWSRPLDNRSQPPDAMAKAMGFSSSVLQGWLFAGDGGPGMSASRRIHA